MKKILLIIAAIIFILFYFDKKTNSLKSIMKRNKQKKTDKKVRFADTEESLKSFDKNIVKNNLSEDTEESLHSFALD